MPKEGIEGERREIIGQFGSGIGDLLRKAKEAREKWVREDPSTIPVSSRALGWFIWDARKGCVPYLFWLLDLYIGWLRKLFIVPLTIRPLFASPPSSFLALTPPMMPSLVPAPILVTKSPRITFSSDSSTQCVAGEEDGGDQSSARTTPVCACIN